RVGACDFVAVAVVGPRRLVTNRVCPGRQAAVVVVGAGRHRAALVDAQHLAAGGVVVHVVAVAEAVILGDDFVSRVVGVLRGVAVGVRDKGNAVKRVAGV